MPAAQVQLSQQAEQEDLSDSAARHVSSSAYDADDIASPAISGEHLSDSATVHVPSEAYSHADDNISAAIPEETPAAFSSPDAATPKSPRQLEGELLPDTSALPISPEKAIEGSSGQHAAHVLSKQGHEMPADIMNTPPGLQHQEAVPAMAASSPMAGEPSGASYFSKTSVQTGTEETCTALPQLNTLQMHDKQQVPRHLPDSSPQGSSYPQIGREESFPARPPLPIEERLLPSQHAEARKVADISPMSTSIEGLQQSKASGNSASANDIQMLIQDSSLGSDGSGGPSQQGQAASSNASHAHIANHATDRPGAEPLLLHTEGGTTENVPDIPAAGASSSSPKVEDAAACDQDAKSASHALDAEAPDHLQNPPAADEADADGLLSEAANAACQAESSPPAEVAHQPAPATVDSIAASSPASSAARLEGALNSPVKGKNNPDVFPSLHQNEAESAALASSPSNRLKGPVGEPHHHMLSGDAQSDDAQGAVAAAAPSASSAAASQADAEAVPAEDPWEPHVNAGDLHLDQATRTAPQSATLAAPSALHASQRQTNAGRDAPDEARETAAHSATTAISTSSVLKAQTSANNEIDEAADRTPSRSAASEPSSAVPASGLWALKEFGAPPDGCPAAPAHPIGSEPVPGKKVVPEVEACLSSEAAPSAKPAAASTSIPQDEPGSQAEGPPAQSAASQIPSAEHASPSHVSTSCSLSGAEQTPIMLAAAVTPPEAHGTASSYTEKSMDQKVAEDISPQPEALGAASAAAATAVSQLSESCISQQEVEKDLGPIAASKTASADPDPQASGSKVGDEGAPKGMTSLDSARADSSWMKPSGHEPSQGSAADPSSVQKSKVSTSAHDTTIPEAASSVDGADVGRWAASLQFGNSNMPSGLYTLTTKEPAAEADSVAAAGQSNASISEAPHKATSSGSLADDRNEAIMPEYQKASSSDTKVFAEPSTTLDETNEPRHRDAAIPSGSHEPDSVVAALVDDIVTKVLADAASACTDRESSSPAAAGQAISVQELADPDPVSEPCEAASSSAPFEAGGIQKASADLKSAMDAMASNESAAPSIGLMDQVQTSPAALSTHQAGVLPPALQSIAGQILVNEDNSRNNAAGELPLHPGDVRAGDTSANLPAADLDEALIVPTAVHVDEAQTDDAASSLHQAGKSASAEDALKSSRDATKAEAPGHTKADPLSAAHVGPSADTPPAQALPSNDEGSAAPMGDTLIDSNVPFAPQQDPSTSDESDGLLASTSSDEEAKAIHESRRPAHNSSGDSIAMDAPIAERPSQPDRKHTDSSQDTATVSPDAHGSHPPEVPSPSISTDESSIERSLVSQRDAVPLPEASHPGDLFLPGASDSPPSSPMAGRESGSWRRRSRSPGKRHSFQAQVPCSICCLGIGLVG